LVFNGRDFEDDARREGRNFLDVNLYSDFEYEGGKLVFSRNKMGKKISLTAQDKSKINFPVDFVYEFARYYSVSERNGDGL